jgi:hypothetical protein
MMSFQAMLITYGNSIETSYHASKNSVYLDALRRTPTIQMNFTPSPTVRKKGTQLPYTYAQNHLPVSYVSASQTFLTQGPLTLI